MYYSAMLTMLSTHKGKELRDNLVRCNLVLTKKLRERFQKEANKLCGGNMSMLLKKILSERYSMASEMPIELRNNGL